MPCRPRPPRRSSRSVFSRLAGGGKSVSRLKMPEAGKTVEPVMPLPRLHRGRVGYRYSPTARKLHSNLAQWQPADMDLQRYRERLCPAHLDGRRILRPPNLVADGTRIAFYHARRTNLRFRWGQRPGLRQITSGDNNHFFPGWSGDGQIDLLLLQPRRHNFDFGRSLPRGHPRSDNRNGGFGSRESTDGQSLYFIRSEASDGPLWQLKLSSGEEIQVLSVRPSLQTLNPLRTTAYYFLDSTSTLKLLNTAGQVATWLHQLPTSGYVGLTFFPPTRKWMTPPAKNTSPQAANRYRGRRLPLSGAPRAEAR